MSSTAEQREGVRPLTRAELPPVERRRASAEWPFEIGLVRLDHLLIDDTYQRPPHDLFVKEIADDFDPTLVGCIDVSERAKGKYAVLDGQQRLLGMLEIGKTACYCSIYKDMSIPDEAAFFYRKNKDRRTMKPYYSFRARVVAGEPDAVAIQAITSQQGFILGDSTNQAEVIGAIKSAEIAYHLDSEFRTESLSVTLRTIRESIFGRKGSLDSWIIQGIARFWQVYSDEEVKHLSELHRALSELGPMDLVRNAREAYIPVSGRATFSSNRISMPLCTARVIVSVYNKTVNPKGRGASGDRLDLKKL